MDAQRVKQAARGRWAEILQTHGLSGKLLDGRGHPCPLCGGKDRFSIFKDFRETGGCICRKCHSKENGDGFSTLQWLRSCDFAEALRLVSSHLGLSNGQPERTLADAFCLAKGIRKEILREYGAKMVLVRGQERIQVPTYGPDKQPCSHVLFALCSAKLSKGLNAPSRPAGLFWSVPPAPGGSVLLVEGVKDACALAGLGFHAIGIPGRLLGEKFVHLFSDCLVTIVPDRDVDGEEGAKRSAALLFGKAREVRLASLPGPIKEKGGNDVRDIQQLEGGDELVREAVRLAPLWTPSGLVSRPVVTSLKDASEKYLESLSSGTTLLSTGLQELDWAIGGGVAASEMVVVAARPGHGKSAFALQWLVTAAKQSIPGLIISQEMSALALGKRSIQHLTSIPADLWSKDLDVVRSHIDDYHQKAAPIWIVEGCKDADQACEVARQEVKEHKVGVIAVDYVQMLRGEGRTRYEQVTDTSMKLKQLASELRVVLIAVCQLGRDIEKRNKMVPQMTDIKESGQIEQDADVIMALQWPLRHDPQYRPRDAYRISIFKVRNREMRAQRIELSFDPSRQLFSQPLDDEYAQDAEFYETLK